MGLLQKLERRLRWLAIPRLTLLLIIVQCAFWLMIKARPDLLDTISMDLSAVGRGQVWRLLTFLFMPPDLHPLWLFFALYLFLLMGNALEHEWGEFRYNLYVFTGAAATVLASLIPGMTGESGAYVAGSVFLAFAWLYPDFQLYIFFILPVKVKWLALLTWIMYVIRMIAGPWQARLLVLAGVANFLLFFGAAIARKARFGHRHMAQRVNELRAFHRCAACGASEKDKPGDLFRVCSQCAGGREYCEEHLRSHEHVTDKDIRR